MCNENMPNEFLLGLKQGVLDGLLCWNQAIVLNGRWVPYASNVLHH